MSSIVIFDAVNSPFKVLQFIRSNADPAAYANRSDVLIDADVTLVAAIPLKYWKHSNGSVVEMTTQEKATADAAEASANLQSAKAAADSLIDALDGIQLRALADVLISEINTLRQRDRDRSADVAAATSLANLQTRWAARSTLNDRTLAQAKTAYKNSLSSGNVDS